jgi:hypothetical protein
MAKPKNGRTEESKIGGTGQKLGCHLSHDASSLLGGLEFLIGGSAGNIVERALVALADTLPRTQYDTLTTMLRSKQANLGRLRKSCGHSGAKTEEIEESTEESRGLDGAISRTNRITNIQSRFVNAVDEAVADFGK